MIVCWKDNQMEKTYKKIEEYLKKNFPKRKIVRNDNLNKGTDFWGFDSMIIMVLDNGSQAEYKLCKIKS